MVTLCRRFIAVCAFVSNGHRVPAFVVRPFHVSIHPLPWWCNSAEFYRKSYGRCAQRVRRSRGEKSSSRRARSNRKGNELFIFDQHQYLQRYTQCWDSSLLLPVYSWTQIFFKPIFSGKEKGTTNLSRWLDSDVPSWNLPIGRFQLNVRNITLRTWSIICPVASWIAGNAAQTAPEASRRSFLPPEMVALPVWPGLLSNATMWEMGMPAYICMSHAHNYVVTWCDCCVHVCIYGARDGPRAQTDTTEWQCVVRNEVGRDLRVVSEALGSTNGEKGIKC